MTRIFASTTRFVRVGARKSLLNGWRFHPQRGDCRERVEPTIESVRAA